MSRRPRLLGCPRFANGLRSQHSILIASLNIARTACTRHLLLSAHSSASIGFTSSRRTPLKSSENFFSAVRFRSLVAARARGLSSSHFFGKLSQVASLADGCTVLSISSRSTRLASFLVSYVPTHRCCPFTLIFTPQRTPFGPVLLMTLIVVL